MRGADICGVRYFFPSNEWLHKCPLEQDARDQLDEKIFSSSDHLSYVMPEVTADATVTCGPTSGCSNRVNWGLLIDLFGWITFMIERLY